MDEEKIVHAAVKSLDGWIFFGKCHADCFRKAAFMNVNMSQKADDQGFLTSTGRFVNRFQAGAVAYRAQQTTDRKKFLFSEDLWSEQSGGRFAYDEIVGYK